ncbi:MAG: hypothetical protein ACR2FY_27080 [Pirellulaceae bacterium]
MQYILTHLSQPWYFLLVLIVDLAAAFICVLALWTGESQKYWFRWGLLLAGTLALFLPIRAYEPLLLFLLVTPMLAGASAWQSRARPVSWRFGLGQLFQFLTLLGIGLGLWMAAVHGKPVLMWKSLPIAAVLIAIFAIRAWQVGKDASRWQSWLKFVGSLLAILIAESLLLGDWMYTIDVFGMTGRRDWDFIVHNFIMGSVLYLPFGLFVMVGSRLTRRLASPADPTSRRHTLMRGIAVALLMIFGLPIVWVYWGMLVPPIPPRASLVEAKDYERLLKIGGALRRASPSSSQALLSEARQLLARPLAVPLDFGKATEFRDYEFGPLLSLRRAIDAESAKAESQGNLDEATQLAIAEIRLGKLLQNGGGQLHAHTGMQCELIAIYRLVEMRSKLDVGNCRAVIAELERAEVQRDPLEDCLRREKLWSDLAMRWRYRLMVFAQGESNVFEDDPQRLFHKRELALNRLMRTDLAIRAFRQETGRLPRSLAELAPRYLQDALDDPFSGEPLKYRADGPNFQLYSVGPDEEDDGGQPIQPGQMLDQAGYDITL